MTKPLPCIVCGFQPECVYPDHIDPVDDYNSPYEATAFTTHGHYGSTVFDEMSRRFLEVNICDKCLIAKGKEGVILVVAEIPQPSKVVPEPWSYDVTARWNYQEEKP